MPTRVQNVITWCVVSALCSGITFPHPGVAQSGGARWGLVFGGEAAAQEQKTAWGNWLTELNGIWDVRDSSNIVRRLPIYFSKGSSVFDRDYVNIVNQDDQAETVTFTYRLPEDAVADLLATPVLRDASPAEQQLLTNLGIDPDKFNAASPQYRSSLITAALNLATYRANQDGTRAAQLEKQVAADQAQLKELQNAGDVFAAGTLENTLRMRVVQLQQIRPSADIAAKKVKELTELLAELTDEAATKVYALKQAEKREASRQVEVTVRRVWNAQRTGYHLAIFEPNTTIQAGFVRRFRDTEIADVTAMAAQRAAPTKPAQLAPGLANAAVPLVAKDLATSWNDRFVDMNGVWKSTGGVIANVLFTPKRVAMLIDNEKYPLELTGSNAEHDFIKFRVMGDQANPEWAIARIPSDEPKGFYLMIIFGPDAKMRLHFERDLNRGERDALTQP